MVEKEDNDVARMPRAQEKRLVAISFKQSKNLPLVKVALASIYSVSIF